MSGVLEGIRVLDLSQGWAGPGAAMYLGDQGADVIKVEPPGGDIARGWYPSPVLEGTSRSFLAINRNKRSITVDLRREEGTEILHRLVEDADVVILNQRPGTIERLRLTYSELAAVNERIIYAAVSGYGARGPYAGKPAYDQIIQGFCGAMDRRLPDGTPLRAGVWVADLTAPMILSYGISLALLARERTGRGQQVDTSILHSAVALQAVELVGLERDPQLPDLSFQSSGVYRCGDDRYINVMALTEKQVIGLCTVLGLDRLLEHESFLSEDRDLTLFQRQWRPDMSEAFLRRPAADWLKLLGEAEVPCGPVLTRMEALKEPQLTENEAVVEMDHPEAGRITLAGVPVVLADAPGGIRLPAPALGQHTDDVLGAAGYSDGDISRLRDAGVVS